MLYKALLAGRDRGKALGCKPMVYAFTCIADMAATMERLDEYRGYNAQFCKRILDYLSIVFSAQGKMLLGDDSGVASSVRGRVSLKDHRNLETYLERYHGLLLYLKEMDESAYAKICAVSALMSSGFYVFLPPC